MVNKNIINGRQGCEFGRKLEIIVKTIKDDISEIKESVVNLSNHYSNRLPLWATTLIVVLTSTCVGLIVYSLKGV